MRPSALAFLLPLAAFGSYVTYYFAANNSEGLSCFIALVTTLATFYTLARIGEIKNIRKVYKILLTLTCFVILFLPAYIILGCLVMLFI